MNMQLNLILVVKGWERDSSTEQQAQSEINDSLKHAWFDTCSNKSREYSIGSGK